MERFITNKLLLKNSDLYKLSSTISVFEGVTFPALHAMTARWIPPEDRSSFISRSMFGSSIGTVITFPMCGALVAAYGWESGFYVFGSLTILWFVVWWILVFDDPEKHPFISRSEKDLIQAAIGDNLSSELDRKVPWKQIFFSLPFIGLMITDSGNTWGLWTLSTNGPTYMKYMLGVDIKTNGLISGLPYLSRYLGGLFFAFIADWLLRRKMLSTVNVRRIFNSISQWGPACAMLVS